MASKVIINFDEDFGKTNTLHDNGSVNWYIFHEDVSKTLIIVHVEKIFLLRQEVRKARWR